MIHCQKKQQLYDNKLKKTIICNPASGVIIGFIFSACFYERILFTSWLPHLQFYREAGRLWHPPLHSPAAACHQSPGQRTGNNGEEEASGWCPATRLLCTRARVHTNGVSINGWSTVDTFISTKRCIINGAISGRWLGTERLFEEDMKPSHDMHTFYPQKTTGFATEISRLRSSNTSIGLGNDSFVPESKKVCGLREQLGSFGIATTCLMRKTIALSGKQHRDRGSNWPQSSKVQPRAASVRTISTDVLWSCSVGINFLSWWWLSVFHINKALNI